MQETLTLPQHADPLARALLLMLLAALPVLAVALPAPSTQASAPIVVFATPALVPLSLSAHLEAPTTQPTEPPTAQPATAPTLAPAEPTIPPTEAPPVAAIAPPATPAPGDAQGQPLVAVGQQVPPGPQQVHQGPDATYITVGDSPVRYYVDAAGQVTEVRLPDVDTAPNGADLSAPHPEAPTAVPVPVPASPRGYLPRAGYRP